MKLVPFLPRFVGVAATILELISLLPVFVLSVGSLMVLLEVSLGCITSQGFYTLPSPAPFPFSPFLPLPAKVRVVDCYFGYYRPGVHQKTRTRDLLSKSRNTHGEGEKDVD